MTENQTETSGTESADLSWLENAQPVKTTMRTSKRGRQPGKNPLMPHVKAAHDSGDVLSLPVPASVARQTERMARRAALREGWSISVQVLQAHPDNATSDDVIALNALDTLPKDADVWVSLKVADKTESERATENADAGSESDPFAGTPDATENADESVTEPETAPETPRKGRRSGKAA